MNGFSFVDCTSVEHALGELGAGGNEGGRHRHS